MKLVAALAIVMVAGCASVPVPPDISLRTAVGSSDAEQVRANLYWCRAEGRCDLDRRNERGETVLHNAAVIGDAGIVRLLLRAGAGVNARATDGASPLHRAAIHGNVDIAWILIGAGADVKARSGNGLTPLQAADAAAQDETASFLRARENGELGVQDWEKIVALAAVIGLALAVFAGIAAALDRRRWRGMENTTHAYAAYSMWRRDGLEHAGDSMSNGSGELAFEPIDDAVVAERMER